jgi:predicted ribosomally synthesized peptide with SipW-like signal peptide
MRRILFPILVIGLTAGLFTLGSGAFFSDVENSTGNTFTAGSLDLKVDVTGTSGTNVGDSATGTCVIAEFYPPTPSNDVIFDGATGDNCTITVENLGNLPGDLYLEITLPLTLDKDNGCNEPENDVAPDGEAGGCDAGNGDGSGDLDEELRVTSECAETNGAAGDGDPCEGAEPYALSTFVMACLKVSDLAQVSDAPSNEYVLTFDLDSVNVTNQSQTDTISITFNFKLVQDGAAAPGTCT